MDRINFPKMAELMDLWNATWEVHTATTDDHWNLNMFRITGFTDREFEITKPPLVVYHPMLSNTEFWLEPGNHYLGDP
jgi:hypothetical protein